MTNSPRNFDLVVFGATGFAGTVAAEYFARHLPPHIRWAVAGRSGDKLHTLLEKLRPLPHPPTTHFILDHDDTQAVQTVVGQCRVVVSYAGPFARYGESVLAACATQGTHYLDITGETLWVKSMLDRYETAAQQNNALIIPFAGFDSVPSDLGAWRVSDLAREKTDAQHPITRVVNLVSVRGGFNGGTYATMMDMLGYDTDKNRLFHNPRLLVPTSLHAQFPFAELKHPVRIKEINVIGPPFFMESINSRVVYRSQALRLDSNHPPFEYQEIMRLPKAIGSLGAWGLAAGSAAFFKVGRIPAVRKLLIEHGLKPGQGPSQQAQDQGFFRAQFFAYAGDRLVSRFEMSYAGDPGNKATALLSCESAMCLILEPERIAPKQGGFWTPSTALGRVLYERLEKAGIVFTTSV